MEQNSNLLTSSKEVQEQGHANDFQIDGFDQTRLCSDEESPFSIIIEAIPCLSCGAELLLEVNSNMHIHVNSSKSL